MMKRLFNLSALLLLFVFVVSCKDKNDPVEVTAKEKLLVNYPWRLSAVTDLNGSTIAANQLNLQTQSIGKMDIQFASNNVTKAIDQGSSQVINGGTWYLKDDSKVLDISISGFSGKFGVEELTQQKMRLKSTMPVNGKDQETIMVFQPVVK